MKRRLVLLALLLCAFGLSARTRVMSHPETRPDGGTVSGIVTAVHGNIVDLAGGLVSVDATGAKIVVGRGHDGSVADIEPGMLLFAALSKTSDVAANAPLPATMITATRVTGVTLFGAVASVDVPNHSLTLMGRTVYVDDDTSFGGWRGSETKLEDIVRNQLVQVQADAVGGRLVASEVLVLAPIPPQVGGLRGVVKSIGTESWVIENDDHESITVLVNAQTKIAGSPKVGDRVEVLYSIDSAHNYVALSIVRSERVPPPQKAVQFHGKVKTIAPTAWTVTTDDGEKSFTVNERTKVMPGIVVGDLVEVLALQNDDGSLTAIAIMKLRM